MLFNFLKFKTSAIHETMGPDSSEGKGKTGKLMVDIEANDKTQFQLNGYLWQKVYLFLY